MRPSTLDELVNRQVHTWAEQERAGRAEGGTPRQAPVVTVSREYGALGGHVARAAAERLGFQYIDREVVDLVARTANVRKAVVESVDEQIQDAISNLVAGLFPTHRMEHQRYLKDLSRVVLTAGVHGRVVIVGRGANFILDPERTLAVRCVASRDVRAARVALHKQVEPREAAARLRSVDRMRSLFCRRSFDRNVADPGNYDLILDTGRLPVDACADAVAAAFRGKFHGEA
jgi:cytidylate kinase